jgi:Lrp/AsnC family transcriptional regulator
MDVIDKKILVSLQRDASLSNEQLGQKLALGTMAVWRRVKRLEEEGYIERRVAIVNRCRVGRGILAFVMLRTQQHSTKWFQKLDAALQAMPEVMEFHRLSGEIDFLLKVSLRDLDDYRRFYDRLTSQMELLDVSTAFAFEQLKYTHELPID